MKVLLSIKPKFANEIFDGNKKYEYRKVIFKNKDIKTIVVYSTMPEGKIIGEFEIDEILEEHPDKIWDMTKEYSGISAEFYNEYFNHREKAYAIKIKSVKKYSEPICPYINNQDFSAPQSFKYLID